jgi:hypothetical protein
MLLFWRRLPSWQRRDVSTCSLGRRSAKFGISSVSAPRAAHAVSGHFRFLPLPLTACAALCFPSHFPSLLRWPA